MTEKMPPQNPMEGRIQIRVEPSGRIRQGVFINVNNHYKVKEKESITGCKQIISLFENEWEPTKKSSESVIYSLIDNFSKDYQDGIS